MTDPDLDRLAAGCKQPSHTQQDANNQGIHRAKQGQAGALSRVGKKAVAHLEAVEAVHRSRLPVAVIFIRVHVLSSKPAPEGAWSELVGLYSVEVICVARPDTKPTSPTLSSLCAAQGQ